MMRNFRALFAGKTKERDKEISHPFGNKQQNSSPQSFSTITPTNTITISATSFKTAPPKAEIAKNPIVLSSIQKFDNEKKDPRLKGKSTMF